jgi:phage FluMu gp28-like protein
MWARAFNYAAGEIEERIWPDSDPDKHIKTYTINLAPLAAVGYMCKAWTWKD